jgi:hypothetical protein
MQARCQPIRVSNSPETGRSRLFISRVSLRDKKLMFSRRVDITWNSSFSLPFERDEGKEKIYCAFRTWSRPGSVSGVQGI